MSDVQLDQIYRLLLNLPDAKERRQDRLLKAAAQLYAAAISAGFANVNEAVDSAERLLKEVERRNQ